MTRRCSDSYGPGLLRGRAGRSAERPRSALSNLRGGRGEAAAPPGRGRRDGAGPACEWGGGRHRARSGRQVRRGGAAGRRGAALAFSSAPCSSRAPRAARFPCWGAEGELEGSQLSLRAPPCCFRPLRPHGPRFSLAGPPTDAGLRGTALRRGLGSRGSAPRPASPAAAAAGLARSAASTWPLSEVSPGNGCRGAGVTLSRRPLAAALALAPEPGLPPGRNPAAPDSVTGLSRAFRWIGVSGSCALELPGRTRSLLPLAAVGLACGFSFRPPHPRQTEAG